MQHKLYMGATEREISSLTDTQMGFTESIKMNERKRATTMIHSTPFQAVIGAANRKEAITIQFYSRARLFEGMSSYVMWTFTPPRSDSIIGAGPNTNKLDRYPRELPSFTPNKCRK